MNSIQLKLLAPEVGVLEDSQGSYDKCINGFFDIIEKVCTAVANFFTTIIRYLCCRTKEEFPDALGLIKPYKISNSIIPVNPINPVEPIASVVPPELAPQYAPPKPIASPVVVKPPLPVFKLTPHFKMEFPVPLMPKELAKADTNSLYTEILKDVLKIEGPVDDFMLSDKFGQIVVDHHRVFVNEQIVNFISGKVPEISYSEFKKKVENAAEVKDNPELKNFYTNYATTERFRAWIQTVNTLPENCMVSKLDVLKDENWDRITKYLDSGSIGFDQWTERK